MRVWLTSGATGAATVASKTRIELLVFIMFSPLTPVPPESSINLDGSTRNWFAPLQTIENFEAMPNAKFVRLHKGCTDIHLLPRKHFPDDHHVR